VGIVIGFLAGWATCARGGQSRDEVVDALKAIRESQEVADLVTALRHHAGFSLRAVGEWLLEAGDRTPDSATDLLARVRGIVQPVGRTSAGS
jgi:hypothetical protein